MISFTLSQVRASVAGSLARYFQKLLTSSSLRVALMSSNTARTCGEAEAVSMGWGMGAPGQSSSAFALPLPARGERVGVRGRISSAQTRGGAPPPALSPHAGKVGSAPGEGARPVRRSPKGEGGSIINRLEIMLGIHHRLDHGR